MTDLHLERELAAPRHLVWEAFTDPDQIAAWFGPDGYSVPRDTVEADVREGGHLRLMMNADGPDYPPGGPVHIVLDHLVENELLLGHEDFDGEMAELFGTKRMELRIELHDAGDRRTRLVLTQGPYSDDFVPNAQDGWTSSFGKLDRLLA